ncbi:MAG: hypothetical protein CMO55_17635 [Verrucomicrobiales bacterium]|nr:hypothetical protein [Verrucomicrobiales bacterium]
MLFVQSSGKIEGMPRPETSPQDFPVGQKGESPMTGAAAMLLVVVSPVAGRPGGGAGTEESDSGYCHDSD